MSTAAGEKGADEHSRGGQSETPRGNLRRSIESCEVPIGAIGRVGPTLWLIEVPGKGERPLSGSSPASSGAISPPIRSYSPGAADRPQVAVAPMRIVAGLLNKVLEGMSMGLPIAVTPQTDEGIGAPTAAGRRRQGVRPERVGF